MAQVDGSEGSRRWMAAWAESASRARGAIAADPFSAEGGVGSGEWICEDGARVSGRQQLILYPVSAIRAIRSAING